LTDPAKQADAEEKRESDEIFTSPYLEVGRVIESSYARLSAMPSAQRVRSRI